MRILVVGSLVMPSLADLSQTVAAYRRRDLSLGEFEDWFRTNSRGMFGEDAEFLDACMAIESAFSRYHFEGISEQAFRDELANAICDPALVVVAEWGAKIDRPWRSEISIKPMVLAQEW